MVAYSLGTLAAEPYGGVVRRLHEKVRLTVARMEPTAGRMKLAAESDEVI